MRAWGAKTFGEPLDVLELEDKTLPEPQEGQIELKVSCAGVGLPDVLMLQGNYPAVVKPPVAPGQEVVGTVTKVGAGANFEVGQKVMASTLFAFGQGGFADYCLGGTAMTFPMPEGMSDEQGAGFIVPYH